MDIVTGHDSIVAQWASERMGQEFHPPYVAVGFLRDQRLCGSAIFNDWNGFNIEVTIYGPGAMCRVSIRYVYRYVFMQIGALRLTARTRRSNKVMCKLLPRLGFTFEGAEPWYFGPGKGDDALRFRLTRSHAERWMK